MQRRTSNQTKNQKNARLKIGEVQKQDQLF